MAVHKWHLAVTEVARSQLRHLSPKDRKAIFNAIRELLEADNPQALLSVKKLFGKFQGQWRQRQGNYRIFFDLTSDPIVFMKFKYKGTVQIQAILHRSEAYENGTD